MATKKFGDILKEAKESGAMGDTVIPDGDFLLEITKSNCKDPEEGPIGLLVKVVGDDEGNALSPDDEANGAAAWINLYFSEKAAPISFRQLKSFGFDESFLAESESAEEIANAAVGIRFTASVGHRNWGSEGTRTSNEFKGVEVVTPPAVGSSPVDPTEPEDNEEPF